MKISALDRVKHLVSQMLNEEHDAHAELVNKITARGPAELDKILENLRVVHETREKLLEHILERLKEMDR